MKTMLCICIAFLLACSSGEKQQTETIDLERSWSFKTGDSLAWAQPDYDDSDWQTLSPSRVWEQQGLESYDGFAWYRIEFELTESFKQTSVLQDSIQIYLGTIDDTEQTFLNGELIGQNGQTVNAGQYDSLPEFTGDPDAYQYQRRYVLALDDPRIQWGGTNTLAIRVHDHGGNGGLYVDRLSTELNADKPLSVHILGIKDYLQFQKAYTGFEIKSDEQLSRTLYVRNVSDRYDFNGQFTVSIRTLEDGREIYARSSVLDLNAGAADSFQYEFSCDLQRMHEAEYVFSPSDFDKAVSFREQVPYILTPPAGEAPSINGPAVYGQRPGNPFLYRIPVSGKRPLEFRADNLPDGLTLDSRSGIITGMVENPGEYKVTVTVRNKAGEDERELTFKIGDQLSLTPPMGWNSWNCWGLTVSDAKVRKAADYMVSTGLVNYGWSFINIDDGWEAPARSYTGDIQTNDKFPDMKALADYVHSRGLKFGIYSSPGPLTCGGYLGSYGHEQEDIDTYSDWGVDYLKYDWCSYERIARDHSLEELQKPYFLMRNIITAADRDIVYSLCQYGMGNVWQWGEKADANLWRTTGDIRDTWTSMSEIGFGQDSLWKYAGPGYWNDPDMLVVGYVGWGPEVHPSQLSYSEQYTHITLWSLLSAPMLLGCDLSKLDDFTLNLLCNAEVIAVNQDPLGEQARSFGKTENYQIWAKELQDGSKAVGVFNMSDEKSVVSFDFDTIELTGEQQLRDLWRQQNLGEFKKRYKVTLPGHDAALIKCTPIK